MTIDEAIAQEKELAKKSYLQGMLCHANPDDGKLDGYIESAEEHEQLAEWLEELKMYKSLSPRELVSEKQRSDRDVEYHKGFNNGYNKAIDEMFKQLKVHCKFDCQSAECHQLECPFCDDHCWINWIAEQLKAGINNEDNI